MVARDAMAAFANSRQRGSVDTLLRLVSFASIMRLR
jgi:hypothetical protein